MGMMLPKPVLSAVHERDGNVIFKVGSACVNGYRESMEDAHIAYLKPEWGFFGVFDGHVNDQCSQYLEEEWRATLEEHIQKVPISDEDLKNYALAIDKKFLDAKRAGGSTGTFFFAHKTTPTTMHMQVGNVGDSRVLVCKDGQCVAMTTDHKPNEPGEKRRIEACRGTVENNRVNGSLAVSRAFGDGDYKKNGDDQLQQQVIALPDVTHTDLALSSTTGDFALLACDGVFEGQFSNEQVIQFVQDQFASGETDLAIISNRVCVEAIARGSKDNISCMIVQFRDGTGYGAETHTEFVAGPFTAPSNANFRRAYFEMARKAKHTPAEALEQRWKQIEQKRANLPAAANYEAADDAEVNFFKTGPPRTATDTQKKEFFQTLAQNIARDDDAGGAGGPGALSGPLQRALALQHQLGIPLHMLLDMMSNPDANDKDHDDA